MSPRILALDPGDKRVGVALSDPTASIATGLPTIAVTATPDLIGEIAALCTSWEVSEVVVGLPLNMDGSEGERAARARDLADKLSRRLDLPVSLVDERLSTVQSERILREGGVKRSRRRALADQMAARIILQSYLDRLPRR